MDSQGRHQVDILVTLRRQDDQRLMFSCMLSWSEETNPVPDHELPGEGPSDYALATPLSVCEVLQRFLDVFPEWVAWLDTRHTQLT